MALLQSVFNHLVLPPKLPGQQDVDLEAIEQNLLTRLIRACNSLEKLSVPGFREKWTSIQHSLRICLDINVVHLERALVQEQLRKLKPNEMLILYVVEQNAALLVRREIGSTTVIFEVIEASPTSVEVLATESALQWEFPGHAVEIPLDEFLGESFCEHLAAFLEQASSESLPRFRASSAKAKVSVIEARDTTDPALITQFLLPLLEAVGSSIEVPKLRKRVRDDVNLQNAELPWRRLPFWLILRVSIHRQLRFLLGNATGRACYKFLICTVLAQLLEECADQMDPELTLLLRAKLCRRLAKLETNKSSASSPIIYDHLFESVGPMLKEIIEEATHKVESAWAKFKTSIARTIPRLPLRADEQDLRLSLPNSGKYFTDLLATSLSQNRGAASLNLAPLADGTIEQVTEFTSKYFILARWERDIETERKPLPESVIDCQAHCAHLAKSIVDAFTVVGNAYDSNPEQMSIFILNLFDLWVQMDQSVVRACPLLLDYAPVFTAELLDVLQMPTLSDMKRLQHIQGYLQSRFKGSRFEQKTIFSEPDRTSFATRYVEQTAHLCKLQQQIEEASNRSRRSKQSEWEKTCIEYDKHTEKMSSGTCVCSNNPDGTRNVKGCNKCYARRCRKRLNITIHEDFLPQDESQKAAVVLELGMPNFLAAYRNATFKILTDLGYPSKPKPRPPPVMLLSDYPQLKKYMNSTVDGVSLASAKKSFLQTHFKAIKMKVRVSDIILPLGLDFSYYDSSGGTWLKSLDKPLTFQHLCGVHVPQSLQDSTVIPLEHPTPNTDGPSSYEIVASQTKCPTEISVHEFMAYQRLLSGKTRRWLSMLVELGASNLNFSAEDTMFLYNHLSIQAGPSQNDNILRDSHVVFQDPSFCERLTKQIELRLRNINTNWREMHCMELLITLSIRLFNLTSGPDRQAAEELLKTARQSTLQWISCLRDEVRNAAEADAAERAARYGFWSALLCRRTFTIFVDSNLKLSAEDISSFVQASVALQENLVVDLAKLPVKLKNMLVRDTKMAYRIRLLLMQSIKDHPDSLGAAINNSWSDSENSTKRTYSRWQFLPAPNKRWVVSVIATTANSFVVSQAIHYNFIEGHLLVDGKPLGKLPLNIRESEDVKELFGNQHLLTFPSSLTGMSHVMATRARHGNEVHFGLRGTTVVIRTLQYGNLLEYVPRSVFVDKDVFDLPLSLIENCVHWLNFKTGQLEIRRKPYIWKTRPSDWNIDIFRRRAQRKRVFLVDPHSSLFKSVAGIFRHFEDSNRLTVYQPIPMKGTLSIEMRRLELSFFVNQSNLVQCRELHAEIDPNQDAGTLYGFLSKIVLRDVANPKLRSIITPLGQLFYKRNGMHVVVRSSNNAVYGKFGIDDILGRLSCPPEPVLLYSKAQFHALTSFVLPDPLTGRTGTEEALHTLKSGYCQPWMPLHDHLTSILKVIRNLSPMREYYPKDLKRLQTVIWDDHLTMNIQHDSYEEIVNEIVAKSDRILAFVTTNKKEASSSDIETPLHLRRRGNFQRLLYERESSDSVGRTLAKDMVYHSRDRQASLPQATKVYQTVQLLRKRPFQTQVEKKLVNILQKWNLIGGFPNYKSDSEIVPKSLGDLMEDDIGEQWGSLVNLCRDTSPRDPYKLIFRLALLSFGTKPNMDVIQLLASFARLQELRDLQPPAGPFFAEFKLFEIPTLELLLGFIEIDLPHAEAYGKKAQERHEKHRILYIAEGRRLACFLLEQWPSSELSARGLEPLRAVSVGISLGRIIPEWQRLYRNFKLSEYATQAQKILDCYNGPKNQLGLPLRSQIPPVLNMRHPTPPIPALSDLLANPTTIHFDSFVPNNGTIPDKGQPKGFGLFQRLNTILFKKVLSKEVIELEKILVSFARSPEVLRQQYGNDLKMSLQALKNISTQSQLQVTPPDAESIKESVRLARKALHQFFQNLQMILSSSAGSYERYKWLDLGGLWPCVTPITLLEQLRSSSNHQFGKNMKEALVSFGVLITTLQRLVRINHASLKGDYNKQRQEWQNNGHENWKPLEFPDWLLLEIESDLLIRSEQIDVAHAIISPASGSNSVLQMNMGKGKTSCIVPMVIAILADQKQLSRLVVPKALLLQTAQTVQSRIGGLVGREIRHVPFSRRTPTTPDMLHLYTAHHTEILLNCGVILTTPEHILSYKLSGLQRLTDSKINEAREMVNFQSWLTDNCRDVLDESDFTLAVKTQLIYPSGPQISVDGHPQRWQVAQIMLSLVEDHLPDLQHRFRQSIEVVKRPGGFPMIHFLRTDVEDALHRLIISDICEGRFSLLRPEHPSSSVSRYNIERVLSDNNISNELINNVSTFYKDKISARKSLLLVRGLLLNRILLLCMKKRWNVQYGLHPKRHPIAVPFDAKGVPSEQAEFGHPDVSILFTCLSFYYAGINPSQFRDGLMHVLKSDDPTAEYDRWTYGSDTLPEALHHWNVINGDDEGQVEELWQHLRFNRNVLDHYMNTFLFPAHAKQFSVKLQASGWDLPLFSKSKAGEKISRAKTTGFSGTNDNKMMLPLTIKQDDLPSLLQTNAEVLTYMLQPSNRQYNLAARGGKRLTEIELLQTISRMKIEILIDAGAYILEMDNNTLVKAWLDMYPSAQGAVYFADDNRAFVQYKGGKNPVPLLATPFAENLEGCIVYIDEAHTRGIDLKLPERARGALTLALGQTKDHTMQAAMRLRQLGTTQSIAFFAPPEVHQSILDVCQNMNGKPADGNRIDSSHVVYWLLEQTCRANEHLQNLYLGQGLDFCRRTDAQWKSTNALTHKDSRTAYVRVIQQPERQTLEQLYGVTTNAQPDVPAGPSAELRTFVQELNRQKQAANGGRNFVPGSALEEVEQEREVEFQIEQVRQVEKQIHYNALTFPGLHRAIIRFATNGNLSGGLGYEHVFDALRRTSIGQKYNVRRTLSQLFVSVEFMRTVELQQRNVNDNFLRPVEWILWCPSTATALIVISEEAELLIPLLRATPKPKMHLIAYAAPVTKNMMHFNSLSYYVLPPLSVGSATVPDWLSIEVGIFAGRLYVDFLECAALAQYLRLGNGTGAGRTGLVNGGVIPRVSICADTPVEFLLEWLTACRMGQHILHTPMGYICQGRPLHAGHPFFATRVVDADVEGARTLVIRGGPEGDGEDDDDMDGGFEEE